MKLEDIIAEIESEDAMREGWGFALTLIAGIALLVLGSGCAAVNAYQSTVSERSDSLGFSKDDFAFTHTVRYK